MRKQFIIILLALLAIFGLMVSCKNEVPNAGFGEELVSISFREDLARGLTATLEGFDKDHLYWAYAAKKADGSNLISGETDSYDVSGAVWVKTDGYNKPVEGLGSTGTSGYEAYKVSGFSQGYWNFKLYAYKGVLGDNPATEAVETDYYVLVYQGEAKNALLKSDSVNAQGSHMVSVTVDPVQSEGNGTMVFLTDKEHAETARISMNTVNSAIYGTNYTVKVLSILSMEDFPVEYVDAAGAKIYEATDSQDGEYTLPAGSYKVTVAFTDSASAPTLNYAKGTIVATVYSNLTTTISGDLTEAMTYAEFDGILNPDLKTVTISSEAIEYDELHPTTQVSFSSTGTAKAVTATTTKAVTNQIIQEIAATNGTNTTEYNQSLVLTLNVETVESTATTATYEIGMSATLTSSKSGDPDVVTTSDVSEVDKHVTVVIQLQPGLEDVNVLHDGHQMAKAPAEDAGYGVFSYDKASGELTIITKSFSPFTVSFALPSEDYVAQVGNLKYLTLSGAIDNASDNATVTLLKNVGETVDFDTYAGILDLAGYKITGNVTASKYGATVRNGSITGTLTAAGNSALIKDLTVTGKISVGGTGAELENCTVTATGDYAVEVATDGNATIKSGTYKAADNQKILNGSIFVEDGNFKGTLTESASVSLVGGVYEYDVKDYVADGYECAKVSEGVYKVRKIVEAWNVTTETDYYFLQDAIDAVASGNTIQILRNINLSNKIDVKDGMSFTLDLNGFSLVGDVDGKFVNVKTGGSLTITDTSEAKTGRLYNTNTANQGSDAVYCAEGGNLTIKAGNFGSSTTQRGASVRNFGTTVIDGGTFTSIKNNLISGAYAYSIINGGAGSLTLNSGEIYGDGQNGGIAINSGSVIINDFKVNDNSAHTAGFGYYGVWVTNDASNGTSVIINDGYFKGNTYGLYGAVDDKKQDEGDVGIIVNGGTFIGGSSAVISDTGSEHNWNLVLYGGLYSSDPSAYVALGYEAVQADEMWTVLPITPEKGVVSVERENANPVYFLNFEDAVDYVESGDTMFILKDCTASGHGTHSYDFSGKNVTIHVNDGKTLACGSITNNKFIIGNAAKPGTLTIEGTGTITFTSNDNYGLIFQMNGGSDIKAIIKEVTIEASSANGYVMRGGNLTIESGYYKNIAFTAGTKINNGYFTTKVTDYGCVIPNDKVCIENPNYPASSGYQYFIFDLKPENANFVVFRGETAMYKSTLSDATSSLKSGDTLVFLKTDVVLDQYDNKFWSYDVAGVTYDLNGHTISLPLSGGYYLQLFDLSSGQVTVKNGTINVPNDNFCGNGSFSINAVNVLFADGLFNQVMDHVNDGVYVKDQEGFFAIQENEPVDYLVKIQRGTKALYFTCADSTYVKNGDSIYVKGYDPNIKFKLTTLGDNITVERASTDFDFPFVVYGKGGLSINPVSDNKREFTAVVADVCEVGTQKYQTLEAGLTALASSGGILKLLQDIDLGELTATPLTFSVSATSITIDFNGYKISGDIQGDNVDALIYFKDIRSGGYVYLIDDSGDGGLVIDQKSTGNCQRGLLQFSLKTKSTTATVNINAGFYNNYSSIRKTTANRIAYFGALPNGTRNVNINGGTFVMNKSTASAGELAYGSSPVITDPNKVIIIDGSK